MREQGTAPVEFAAGTLLLLVPVLVLVMSFAPALERRVLARSLAADIGRTLALGWEDAGEPDRWLRQAALSGVAGSEVRVAVCGAPLAPLGSVGPCAESGEVVVTVVVDVDGIVESVSHTHTEPVPPYRSRS